LIETSLFKPFAAFAIYRACQTYDTLREVKVNEIKTSLLSLVTSGQSALESLNLPALIDAAEETAGVPINMMEKSEEFLQQGGFKYITLTFKSLEKLNAELFSRLDEIDTLIFTEETEDKRLREEFGSRWTRISSDLLNGSFKSQLGEYKVCAQKGENANNFIKSKIDGATDDLKLLSSSPEELADAIPTVTSSQNLKTKSFLQMKKVFEALRQNMETCQMRMTALEEHVLNDDFAWAFLT